ncbi:hypothetical protein ACX801_12530 [Arthrobacter bambusae]
MEVILTIEAPDGTQSTVRAAAGSYEEARTSAEALVPEGHRIIVIRTDHY